ncbi:Sds3p [Sporobolomyces koalae]|uniref:Sds3p n=1 Tax=Sporobolomyces koalae TaxID=500713 RepID=UPI003174EA87
MQQAWSRHSEPMSPMYPEEYDQYAAHAAHAAAVSQQQQAVSAAGAGAAPVGESKRDKRRREMTDRVQRLHEDTVARRDRVYHELSQIYARTADELLPPPVFPISDPAVPVSRLPPSVACTDPLFPDMFPTQFLFSLHQLSMERANRQLEIRLFHTHQVASARRSYDAEVERIEDEYEGATKGVVERLLEAVEDRRRKLMEEKEGEGGSTDAFLDPQRTHGTRRMRGGPHKTHTSRPHLPSNNGSGSNGAASPSESISNGRGGDAGVDASALGSLLGLNPVSDPFGLASSLLPGSNGVSTSTANSLSALSGVGPTASILSGTLLGIGTSTKRKVGGRTQPGLPPTHYLVQSGTYSQFGKSIAGLSALRGEEIEGDLVEVRRKRQRVATGAARRRNYE